MMAEWRALRSVRVNDPAMSETAIPGVVANPWLHARFDVIGSTIVVCTVRGELDAGTLPVLEGALAQIEADAQVCSVVFDLSEVTFCSIMGAEWLLRGAGQAAVARREFVLVLKTYPVRRALELTGADREIPWYATRADAIEGAQAWSRVAAAIAPTVTPTPARVS